MNAQEQYNKYSQIIEKIYTRREQAQSLGIIGAIPNLDAYSFDLAIKIVSDLKLKIQAYGDKAYPMTEKQVETVECGLKEEVARINEMVRARNIEHTAEKAVEAAIAPTTASESIDMDTITFTAPSFGIDKNEDIDTLAMELFGQTIEEIQTEVAADNPTWKPGQLDRMFTNLDTDENNFISVTDAAKQASVNVSYVRAEIASGRLVAKKIGNQWAIQRGVFAGWLNNPKRGSRQ